MEAVSTVGEEISENLFGGNILANRGDLYGDGQYDDAISHLNVTDLRYPGGSLTEYYFDISDPNRTVAAHSETGEIKSMIALSDFLDYANSNGHSVTMVVPTRHYVSNETDENGDRFANVDEIELQQFIRDIVAGEYGNADITAFEIGNEYWHSGDMSAVEYGRVAADMATIIDDEISRLAGDYPEAEHIDVVVQMGYNHGTSRMNVEETDLSPYELVAEYEETFGIELDHHAYYSNGNVNHTNVVNNLILNELEADGAMASIDGVVAHIYSMGEDNTWSRISDLREIDQTWLEEYPDLETYVTEWNLKGISGSLERDADYGLHQAAEILNMVEEFVQFEVDHANVWPLIQNTSNAFGMGQSYDTPNAPGALFSMLAENLPGKMQLDLNGADHRKTEAEFEDLTVHGFADFDDLLLYIASSHSQGVIHTNIDLGELVSDFDSIEISVLGVPTGSPIGSNDSAAEIEIVDPADAMDDGFIDIPLDPHEIVQVIVRNYEPTSTLAEVMGGTEEDSGDVADEDHPEDPWDFPVIPIGDDEDEQSDPLSDDAGDPYSGDDAGGDMLWMLLLLPLFALLGMG